MSKGLKNGLKFGFVLLASILIFNPIIILLLPVKLITGIIFSLIGISGLLLLFCFLGNKRIFIYIVNVIIIFSLFLHVEVLFRHRYSQYSIDNLYSSKKGFYINKPNLHETIEDKEFSCTYRTNNQGFRIPANFDNQKTFTKSDWLFIGDSYTQGAQVNFENLYTSKLYNYFPDKIIINSGISGLGIAEEYELFKYLEDKLNPNVLFLQLCSFNDFMNVKPKRVSWNAKLAEISDFYRYIYYNLIYKSPAELPAGRWTEPFSPNQQDNIDYNIFFKEGSKQKREDLKYFTEYFKRIKEFSDRKGIELIVLLIPTKEQVYYKFFSEVVNQYNIDVSKLDMHAPNRILEILSDSFNVRVIDLLPSFSESSNQLFFDFDEHLNNYGHDYLAKIISDSLESWGEISKSNLISESYNGQRYGNYSDDSSLFIYQEQIDGNMELLLKEVESGMLKRLTFNSVDDIHPRISPKLNKVILTQGFYDNSDLEVVEMNIMTGFQSIITSDENEYGAIPFYSSKGDKIVYASWRKTKNQLSNPTIKIVSSMDFKPLFEFGEPYNNWRPVFGQNDTSIIFISDRNGNYDLFQHYIYEDSTVQLTNTTFDEWDPYYIEYSNSIVYAGKPGNNWDIFLLDLESMYTEQLTWTKGDEWDPFTFGQDRIIYSGEFGPFNCIYKKEAKLKLD